MPSDNPQIEALKFILENSLHPERLDAHPWARSPLATQYGGSSESLGQRLVASIADLFVELMPSIPPRHGKRLDTRWGEFGLLAAQYFAPIVYGSPVPDSLREAWGRIDQSILLFVYGKPDVALSSSEKDAYKLVADEPEIAPHSTLSDWHRKGLQRLLQAIIVRESYLAKSLSEPAVISSDRPVLFGEAYQKKQKPPSSVLWWAFVALLILILLGFGVAGGLKARQVYYQTLRLREDVAQLQFILSSYPSNLERARHAGPVLAITRADFIVLKTEVEPYLWLGPWLSWVPEYGGELAASEDLANYADALLAASDLSYQALLPVLEAESAERLTPTSLLGLLRQAGPQLIEARQELDRAVAARGRLEPERLSARVRALILEDIDPLVIMMQDGLALAIELPRAMGASSEGPKTYLLLAVNEDELRPAGGFITAAGTILAQDGRINNPVFQNSGFLEDWTKPYPVAPWQLSQYMNSPVLIFRDTTWFADYPVAALYAEQLYSYVNAHSVDGVLAFDQQFLVKLLRATGPIQLPQESVPISAENVIAYMRTAKQPTAEDLANPDWENKLFITEIARVLVDKLLNGDIAWERLSSVVLAALNERNLLIQVDNPVLADFLLRQGWNGAVRPSDGDFLMVADSNIGFNKTNALVETRIEYEVDLRKLLSPTATLLVTHQNNAAEMFTCSHWQGKVRAEGEHSYPITDCYWNYMRVYRPAGTQLLDSIGQFIPANWMLNYKSVPPRVDILGDEEIDGVQSFGTLKVVPGGQSVTTAMRFALPLVVFQMQTESGLVAYRLRVQKQPGTESIPILIRIYLAPGSALYRAPDGTILDGDTVTYPANLRTDLQFELYFYPP